LVTPSEQLGESHVPLVLQTPLEQSVPALQATPSGQPGQLPPQSMSVSVPFWTKSVQEAT